VWTLSGPKSLFPPSALTWNAVRDSGCHACSLGVQVSPQNEYSRQEVTHSFIARGGEPVGLVASNRGKERQPHYLNLWQCTCNQSQSSNKLTVGKRSVACPPLCGWTSGVCHNVTMTTD
jgi:hypothetical protein